VKSLGNSQLYAPASRYVRAPRIGNSHPIRPTGASLVTMGDPLPPCGIERDKPPRCPIWSGRPARGGILTPRQRIPPLSTSPVPGTGLNKDASGAYPAQVSFSTNVPHYGWQRARGSNQQLALSNQQAASVQRLLRQRAFERSKVRTVRKIAGSEKQTAISWQEAPGDRQRTGG
jgi:hypothetical protein